MKPKDGPDWHETCKKELNRTNNHCLKEEMGCKYMEFCKKVLPVGKPVNMCNSALNQIIEDGKLK